MYRRIMSAAVLLCLAASAFAADDKITLRVKYPPGTYVTTTKVDSDSRITGPREANQKTAMTMVMEMVVDKPTGQGQQIHVTFRRLQQSMKAGGQEMSYDSARKGDDKNPMAVMGGIIDVPIDVTLDADGKVVKVTGMDEVWDKLAKDNPAGERMAAQLKKTMGEKMMTEMFDQSRRSLPAKPVGVGDTWEVSQKLDMPMAGAMNLKMVCTLKKIEEVNGKKIAVVDIVGGTEKPAETGAAESKPASKMKMDIQQAGTIKLNVATGMTEESDITQDMSMDMDLGDQTAAKMSIKGKSNIHITMTEGKYVAPKVETKE